MLGTKERTSFMRNDIMTKGKFAKDFYILPTIIKSYIKQVKNPYLFKVGDTAVRIRFTESGPSFEEKLLGIIRFYDRLNHY